VPFTTQAPLNKWVEPWENACEETSIVMVNQFFTGTTDTLILPELATEQILNIFSLKEETLGWSLDESAKDMATIINGYLSWEVRLVENPTIEQIQNQINTGFPIIVPAYGKALFNPNFRQGGPEYHVFVISGYDDVQREFIVQEPGTRRGQNYRYPYDRVMTANHDYLFRNTRSGKCVMLFASPDLSLSKDSDADADGLTKENEILYRTSLTDSDTDRDGFTDGQEVSNGFSPTVNESVIEGGDLVKVADSPKVYVLWAGQKRHILTASSFVRHGWDWKKIQTVSQKFLDQYSSALPIL